MGSEGLCGVEKRLYLQGYSKENVPTHVAYLIAALEPNKDFKKYKEKAERSINKI